MWCSVTFVSFAAGFKKQLTQDCNSAYTTLKLLSAPSKSKLISEFFEFPTDVSQTTKVLRCSTNALNGFPSDKKKKKSLTTSQPCRNPSSSLVLSAFLVEHERAAAATKTAGLNLACGRVRVWSPLYCTSRRLTESVHIHPGLFKASQSEQIKSECPYGLTCSHSRRDSPRLTLTSEIQAGWGKQQMYIWRPPVSRWINYVWYIHTDTNTNTWLVSFYKHIHRHTFTLSLVSTLLLYRLISCGQWGKTVQILYLSNSANDVLYECSKSPAFKSCGIVVNY